MAVLLETSKGDLVIDLLCEDAPVAAKNFLKLCKIKYYNFSLFHNVQPSSLIQTGDPTGTGKGGASVWGGAFDDEFHADNRHDRRGVLSMANKGADTNRSQFFITYDKQPHLNNKYTVFGRVIDGHETLDAMEKIPVGKKDRPLTEIKLSSITIHANPLADSEIVYLSPNGPPARAP